MMVMLVMVFAVPLAFVLSACGGGGGGGGGGTVDAVRPTIATQPSSSVVGVNDDVTLTTAATVTDGGVLSYQWFTNSTNTTTGATLITEATETTFAPNTESTGIAYYFVVVTNTNALATGDQTATRTSNIASIDVRERVTINIEGGTINNGASSGEFLTGTQITIRPTTGIAFMYFTKVGLNQIYAWRNNETASVFTHTVTGPLHLRAVNEENLIGMGMAGFVTRSSAETAFSSWRFSRDVSTISNTLHYFYFANRNTADLRTENINIVSPGSRLTNLEINESVRMTVAYTHAERAHLVTFRVIYVPELDEVRIVSNHIIQRGASPLINTSSSATNTSTGTSLSIRYTI